MSRPRSSLGLGSLLVAVLIVLAVGVGTVYAAIPNGSGTYFACLTKSSGVVRLINYPKVKCAKGEKLINWNAKGPAGPAGAQGVQGPQGAAGPADWNAIPNIPAGFADGVDNEGVTSVRIIYKEGTSVSVPPGAPRQTSTKCPPGSIAVAGGFTQGGNSIRVTESRLFPNAVDTWFVSGFNTGTELRGLVPFATCLEVTPSGGLTIAKKGVKVAEAKKRGK